MPILASSFAHPWRSPGRVGSRHFADQRPELAVQDRPASAPGPALLRPEAAKPFAVPTDHGGRLDDGEHLLPTVPDAGQDHPQDSVAGLNREPTLPDGPLQHADLVPQREVLEREFALRLPQRPGGREEAQEQVQHGRGC